MGCFIGFEATTIYAEEACEPEKTIPRATYLSPLAALILPVVSGLVMAVLFVYIFLHFGGPTGTTGGALGIILPSLIPASTIVGYNILAVRLERRDPARFARMGQNRN